MIHQTIAKMQLDVEVSPNVKEHWYYLLAGVFCIFTGILLMVSVPHPVGHRHMQY